MGWRERNRPADYTAIYGFHKNGVWVSMWRGWHSGGSCRSFRPIRTTAEKRDWDREYGRAKRSPRQLPMYEDERIRCVQRSWKAQRRHQYKVIDMNTKRKVGSAC